MVNVLSSLEIMVEFAGVSLEPEQIVDFLKKEIQLKSVCQHMVYQQIIQTAAQERNLEIDPGAIQTAANEKRFEMRLEKAEDTLRWLTDELMTPEDWEAGLRDCLLKKKLRDTLFGSDVERIFAQSRLDFEQIRLYRIRVPYLPLAQELFYQIEEEEISFYEAAHLYDIDQQRRLQCGYEGQFNRASFDPQMAATVFGATIGEILGPFTTSQGYDLLMVESFIPAELTEENRQAILNRLFQEWLDSELDYLEHNRT